MVRLNRAQRAALKQVFYRCQPLYNTPKAKNVSTPSRLGFERVTYKAFRASVTPVLDGSGAVLVPWCGMHLGIEPDGYIHS